MAARLRALALALIATAVMAPAAQAQVLVHQPDSYVACDEPIVVGVWYQSYSGGPKWARITIKNMRGQVVRRINTTATTRWRYWRFYGACGHQYSVKYDVPGGTLKTRVRVGE